MKDESFLKDLAISIGSAILIIIILMSGVALLALVLTGSVDFNLLMFDTKMIKVWAVIFIIATTLILTELRT